MTDVVDLSLARAQREDDNAKVSVADLLRVAVNDCKDGADLARATKALLCFVVEHENGEIELMPYRCGFEDRSSELGYIEAFKMLCWSGWIK